MALSPRLKLLVLLLFVIALLLALVFIPNPSYAQGPTDTPTPSLTPTPPNTYTPYPQSMIVGTIGTPTNIPALSLTPKPWHTPTRLAPGQPYAAPTLILSSCLIDCNVEHGFEAISDPNVLSIGGYIALVIVGFYGWLAVNFPTVLRGLRMFGIIVFLIIVLYREFRRWSPELTSQIETWRHGEPIVRTEEDIIENEVLDAEVNRLARIRRNEARKEARQRLGITDRIAAERAAAREARAAQTAAKQAERAALKAIRKAAKKEGLL